MLERAEIPHFNGWGSVAEGFYTKTTLRKDFGLKPSKEECDATVLGLNYKGNRQHFELYHIDNTVEIKKRTVKSLEMTLDNLAQALYIVNKSAKISRDTKKENYSRSRHNIVSTAKNREYKLYDLKNRVMDRLLTENLAKVEGYHIQKLPQHKHPSYLLLIRLRNFTFHQPINRDSIENYKLIGEIDTTISSEKTIQTSIGFFESVDLLERFVDTGFESTPHLVCDTI